ncbi:MAG: hypothetical protein JWO06_3343 [Bacteroidota bacterium]|nr:hypothetical protein [Bacteroidota bacterium]
MYKLTEAQVHCMFFRYIYPMKCSLFILLLISTRGYSQPDTTWFDAKWNKVARANAAYFRPTPKMEGNRYYIIDYYINGKKQMEGWAFTPTGEQWDGTVKYYYNNERAKSIATFKNKQANGPALDFYPDGILHQKATLLNGKWDGKFYSYSRDGVLEMETEYYNGKQNGILKRYYFDGPLKETYKYVNDSMEGDAFQYYRDSTILAKTHFTNNKANGDWTEYFSDGKLKAKALYKNGKREGLTTENYASGQLKFTYNFLGNKKNGQHVAYYSNGNKQEEGVFSKDEKTGEWKYFNEDGQLRNKVPGNYAGEIELYRAKMVEDEPKDSAHQNGRYFKKRSDGTRQIEGGYKNNKKEGLWKYYATDGRTLLKENYKDGLLDGIQIFYTPTGEVMKELYYKQDLLHGPISEYDERGKIKLKLFFINGKEQYDEVQFKQNLYGKKPIEQKDAEMATSEETVVAVQEEKEEAKIKVDTISNKGGILKLTSTINKAEVGSNSENFDSVIMNIYVATDSSDLLVRYRNYLPKDNEIMFFYGDNSRYFSPPQILFSIGTGIRAALINYSLRPINVILLLQNRIFENDSFPGPFAYKQLQRQL